MSQSPEELKTAIARLRHGQTIIDQIQNKHSATRRLGDNLKTSIRVLFRECGDVATHLRVLIQAWNKHRDRQPGEKVSLETFDRLIGHVEKGCIALENAGTTITENLERYQRNIDECVTDMSNRKNNLQRRKNAIIDEHDLQDDNRTEIVIEMGDHGVMNQRDVTQEMKQKVKAISSNQDELADAIQFLQEKKPFFAHDGGLEHQVVALQNDMVRLDVDAEDTNTSLEELNLWIGLNPEAAPEAVQRCDEAMRQLHDWERALRSAT